MYAAVASILARWYDENKRDLPWRDTNSPYYIWLSEVIMQQTRVNQGIDYFRKFVDHFPEIEELAEAPLDEVLKLWQGLGYYTRARNLHSTAKSIVNNYGGHFPGNYEGLLKLKGIGPYSAAAIASMAFNEPVALVDGNVHRVISRLFGISEHMTTASGKELFKRKAGELLDQKNPGSHNQAIMEFGALVCLPRNPKCDGCMLVHLCVAFKTGTVDSLPAKKIKKDVAVRYFNYLFIVHKHKTWLRKRTARDIWYGLYEFPLIETQEPTDIHHLLHTVQAKKILQDETEPVIGITHEYKHKLTHQTLHCRFTKINTNGSVVEELPGFISADTSRIFEYAVPRVIDRYLKDLVHAKML